MCSAVSRSTPLSHRHSRCPWALSRAVFSAILDLTCWGYAIGSDNRRPARNRSHSAQNRENKCGLRWRIAGSILVSAEPVPARRNSRKTPEHARQMFLVGEATLQGHFRDARPITAEQCLRALNPQIEDG